MEPTHQLFKDAWMCFWIHARDQVTIRDDPEDTPLGIHHDGPLAPAHWSRVTRGHRGAASLARPWGHQGPSHQPPCEGWCSVDASTGCRGGCLR